MPIGERYFESELNYSYTFLKYIRFLQLKGLRKRNDESGKIGNSKHRTF